MCVFLSACKSPAVLALQHSAAVGPPLLYGVNPQHRAVGVTAGRGDPTEARTVIQPRSLRYKYPLNGFHRYTHTHTHRYITNTPQLPCAVQSLSVHQWKYVVYCMEGMIDRHAPAPRTAPFHCQWVYRHFSTLTAPVHRGGKIEMVCDYFKKNEPFWYDEVMC